MVRLTGFQLCTRERRSGDYPQSDPANSVEETLEEDSVWQRNYSSVSELSSTLVDVLNDKSNRGQILNLSEPKHATSIPISASPPSVPSERMSREASRQSAVRRHERVLRTRIRDQERRSHEDQERESTYWRKNLLTHSGRSRQVPADPRDWRLLGCQVETGDSIYQYSWHIWSRFRVKILVFAASLGRITQYLVGRSGTTRHQPRS